MPNEYEKLTDVEIVQELKTRSKGLPTQLVLEEAIARILHNQLLIMNKLSAMEKRLPIVPGLF